MNCMEVKTLATMPIAKVDEVNRTVIGVVYKASKEIGEDGKPVDKSTVDTHGNWATEAEVKKACTGPSSIMKRSAMVLL